MTFLNKCVFTVQDLHFMKLVSGISVTLTLQDPYADASIGNITGSNSVNVCLVAERSSEFDGHGPWVEETPTKLCRFEVPFWNKMET